MWLRGGAVADEAAERDHTRTQSQNQAEHQQSSPHVRGTERACELLPLPAIGSEVEVAQSRMVERAGSAEVPVELPVGLVDRDVVDARVTPRHQAAVVELRTSRGRNVELHSHIWRAVSSALVDEVLACPALP